MRSLSAEQVIWQSRGAAIVGVPVSLAAFGFICEYSLNTSEFPCDSNWTTDSSATPPELRRVAYVERRS
jgi:hypothetical protein